MDLMQQCIIYLPTSYISDEDMKLWMQFCKIPDIEFVFDVHVLRPL